jgi:hypothetical protein
MTSDESALWPRPMTPLTPDTPEQANDEDLAAYVHEIGLIVAILVENAKPHTKRQILKALSDMEDSNG